MRPILLPRLEPDTGEKIERWIVENMPAYAEGAVLGMSGGVDSSVVAALTSAAFRNCAKILRRGYPDCLNAPETWKLTLRGYALPTKLNSPADVEDAQRVAKLYDIPFDVFDISAMAAAMDATFGSERLPGNPVIHLSAYDRGNAISRARANALWSLAAHYKSIVMGTGNKDEDYSVGYYTMLGDGAVYMNPLGFLPKRLVRELGAERRLPMDLVKRTPAAGLELGQTDAKDLGYPYEFAELVTQGIDQGFSMWNLVQHPQIYAFDRTLSELGRFHAARAEAIFDVLHRHDLAKRKAAYICPKVPNIVLPLVLPDRPVRQPAMPLTSPDKYYTDKGTP